MNEDIKKPLAHYLDPSPTEEEIHRQWMGVHAELVKSRAWPGWLWWRAAAAATVVMAAAGFLLSVRTGPPIPEPAALLTAGDIVETDFAHTRRGRFPDRSSILVSGSSRVEVLAASARLIRVSVRRGVADFQVVKSPDRSFRVITPAGDVGVVGTRFQVQVVAGVPAGKIRPSVRVAVSEGVVEVWRTEGGSVSVHQGETWSSSVAIPPTQVTSPSPSPAGRPPAPVSPAKIADPGRGLSAIAPRGRPDFHEQAQEAFHKANDLLLRGTYGAAADAFEEFGRKFPRDSSAALAAFELGRLRLDVFHDAALAAVAFRRALALQPQATLREDLEARLIEALDASHDRTACLAARSTFLRDFPGSPHARTTMGRCQF